MTVTEKIAAAMDVIGSVVLVENRPELGTFYASIQPAFYEKEQRGSALGLGLTERFALYTEVGPAAMAVEKNDVLLWQGRRFLVQRIETIWLGLAPVYRKGALCLAVGEEGP